MKNIESNEVVKEYYVLYNPKTCSYVCCSSIGDESKFLYSAQKIAVWNIKSYEKVYKDKYVIKKITETTKVTREVQDVTNCEEEYNKFHLNNGFGPF